MNPSRLRHVRSGRNPGFNVSWWTLYKAAITGLCGTSTHQNNLESAAELAARAAQIADAAWNVWTERQKERESVQ